MKRTQKILAGVFAPVCTPFGKKEDILLEGLAGNIEAMNQTGLAGYFVLGTNGEFKSLSEKEQFKTLNCCVKHSSPDKLIMAGTGAESTVESIRLVKKMADAGADLVSLLMPGFFAARLDDAALIRHILAIADASPVCLTLYNNPSVSAGVSISKKVLLKTKDHDKIIGIKDSSRKTWRESVKTGDSFFSVLAGSAGFFFDLLEAGGSGGILSLANVFPAACSKMHELYVSGKRHQAQRLNSRLVELNKKVSGRYGVAGVKAAMDIVGLRGGDPRQPLSGLNKDQKNELRVALQESGLLKEQANE